MDIVRADSQRAPIIVIYGAEGRGKTTLGAKFPSPLFLLLERGLPRGVSVDVVHGVKTFAQIMAALRHLYQDKANAYRTLVVDTVDQLETAILDHVCAENRWAMIETPAFGKGWVAADVVWRQFLHAISALRDNRNMTIVLIGHSSIERIEDPRAPSFTSYGLRLHRRARSLVMDAADIIGFLADDLRTITEDTGFNRERTRAAASPTRFLFVEGTPAFTAKNRYGMPSRIEIARDFNVQTLMQYFHQQKEP
jgi:hypothetical protein